MDSSLRRSRKGSVALQKEAAVQRTMLERGHRSWLDSSSRPNRKGSTALQQVHTLKRATLSAAIDHDWILRCVRIAKAE